MGQLTLTVFERGLLHNLMICQNSQELQGAKLSDIASFCHISTNEDIKAMYRLKENGFISFTETKTCIKDIFVTNKGALEDDGFYSEQPEPMYHVGDVVIYKTMHVKYLDGSELLSKEKTGTIEEVLLTPHNEICYWIAGERFLISQAAIIDVAEAMDVAEIADQVEKSMDK